jgi:hypothetical protein
MGRFLVRYLWITSYMILFAGVALLAGGLIGILGPIALVGGLLLLWTGIVKIVVLRIWKRSISLHGGPFRTPKAEPVSQMSRSSG